MRAYIPDLNECFRWLDQNNFKYVVLREPEIYLDGFPKPGSKQDVDILIDDDGQRAIEKKYGKGFKWRGVKCDIYSCSGLGKGAYNDHPYFPAKLAQNLLENRRRFRDMFFVPSLEDHFNSLLYHIVFQKAEGSKVGFDDPEAIKSTKYYKPLLEIASDLKIELPMTLIAMFSYLKSCDLEIPLEWLRKDVMTAFANHRKSFFQGWLFDQFPGEFNSFVIRKTARKFGREAEIIDVLKKHYEIIEVKELTFTDQRIQARKMRGNKWRNGGPPVQIVLVFDPNPEKTTKEERKIHPFVFNNKQFFKRAYRENYLSSTTAHRKANPLHSTDNEAEAIGHLPLFFKENEIQEIFQMIDKRRANLLAEIPK